MPCHWSVSSSAWGLSSCKCLDSSHSLHVGHDYVTCCVHMTLALHILSDPLMKASILQDTRWEDAAAILRAWLQHSFAIPAAKAG